MPKKFRFRLERVHQYRQVVKDEKQRDLLQELNTLREIEEAIVSLEQAFVENEVLSKEAQSVHSMELFNQYSKRLQKEIEHQKERQIEQEENVEKVRAVYIEAAKEAESLDNLKAKLEDEYLEYIAQEDEKFLDELTIQRTGFLKKAKE